MLPVCFFVLFTSSVAVAAQSTTEEEALRQRTRETILLMTNLDFAQTDRICAELTSAYPGAPHAFFLESYKLFWRFYLSGDDQSRTAEFKAAIQRLITACGARDTRYEQDRLLFLACAHFFLAVIQEKQGRVREALIETRAMTSAAAELLHRYPDLIDARFITGATAAYSRASSAPTVDLALAAERGYYFAPVSKFVLAQTLADRNKSYSAALPLYRQLTAEHPGNALFQFELARTYQRMDRLADSLDAYRRVVSTYHLNPPATCLLCRSHFSAGQILEKNGLFAEAIGEYENALLFADPCDEATAWFVPWSHLQLGKCLEKAGKPDLALSHLARVTKEADRDAFQRAQKLAAEIQARVGAASR